MSLPYRFNRFSALLIFAMCVTTLADAQDQTGPAPRIVTAKIKVDDLSMIIVPVSVNGSRPYDFLLDTGAAKSMIDRKLAGELGLPEVGEKIIVGMLASTKASVVHVSSLSVAGATVGAGDLFSSDTLANVSGKVRGVLGEDFLKNFDVLLDYRHQVIELESASGSLAERAAGEHLPLRLDGVLLGQATNNRLVLSGNIPDLDGKPMTLLLDSGTNQMVVFRDKLEAGVGHTESVRAGSFGSWASSEMATRKVRSLSLGRSSVDDLTVVGVSRRPYVDTDGLLPTSMFHSIFISHRDRFVILNPSFSKTTRDEQAAKTAR